VDGNANGVLDAGDTQITQYTWDWRNRLGTVTERATYGGSVTKLTYYYYDAFNRLVTEWVDPDGAGSQGMMPTSYVYDGDQVALEFKGSVASNLSDRFLWGPAVDQVLADEQVTSLSAIGSVIWPLADNLGTVRDLARYNPTTNTTTVLNHRVYDAFGKVKSACEVDSGTATGGGVKTSRRR
jgi:hypothetical protein